MSTINAKKDSKNTKMAGKAADLSTLAQAVWTEKNFEQKKAKAILMAEQFEVGGKDAFILAVQNCPNAAAVDKITGNAMLKGEGMSTKRW